MATDRQRRDRESAGDTTLFSPFSTHKNAQSTIDSTIEHDTVFLTFSFRTHTRINRQYQKIFMSMCMRLQVSLQNKRQKKAKEEYNCYPFYCLTERERARDQE